MASVQERAGKFRIQFRFNGRRESLNLGKVTERAAAGRAAKIEEVLSLLGTGYLQLPPGIDVVEFVRHDGKPPAPNPGEPLVKFGATLGVLRDRYLGACRGSLETNTVALLEIHFRHLVRTLGEALPLKELGLASLQRHADRRKGTVSATTIRKEFITLRSAWNWGVPMKLVVGPFPPLKAVKLPKQDEKPPFMTWAEAERSGQWDALYLTVIETAELLKHVKERAVQPWVYPMCVLAAFTGVRRSELLRALAADVDLEAGVITVRERKRCKGQRTTRRVPLAPVVKQTLCDWLAVHPGGDTLFTQHEVERSKKCRPAPIAVTPSEAHDHLKRCLAGSKWGVVRGYHLFRHSFISACASKGIDQRFIDEWAGHSTEEQRRRYRHLFPSIQQAAIRNVFGT